MNYLNLTLRGLLFCFILADLVFPQSICFDILRDGQVRSDYYTPELVCIPTDYQVQSSPTDRLKGAYSTLEVIKENYGNIGNYNSNFGPIPDLYVGTGTYTLKLRYYEIWVGEPHFVERASHIVTIHEKYTLRVANSFNSGTIMLDGTVVSNGTNCLKFVGENMFLEAIDQSSGEYNYVWKEYGTGQSIWSKRVGELGRLEDISGATSRDINYSIQSGDNRAAILTNMKRICNIQVQNNMSGNTDKGEIWINEVPHTSPYRLTLVEGDPLTITASDYDFDGMHYVFNHWEDNSTSPTRYISVNSHSTYTAYYKGTPVYTPASRYLQIQNDVRAHPVLTWTPHPNPLITSYKIYRKVLKGPNADPGSLINEVSSNIHTYTDIDYYNNGTQSQDMIFYDVDAFCASEQTSSEQNWEGLVFGILVKQRDSLYAENTQKELNTEYSLSSYPNPFNPSTQIRYSIKEGGLVSLQIYDILGNKVANLVNEYKPAGTYFVNFDGTDKPTGIYICSIKSNNYAETKKLLLIK